MSNIIIDKDFLKQDSTLSGLVQQIKDKLSKGHILELKTVAELKSQSSNMISIDGSMIREKLPLMPFMKLDTEPLNTLSSRDGPLLNQSFSIIQGPRMDNVATRPQMKNQVVDTESSQKTLDSDEEPENIMFIQQRLSQIETAEDKISLLDSTRQIYGQVVLLIYRNRQNKQYYQQYTLLAVKSVIQISIILQKMGNFAESFKQLNGCIKKFTINDPNLNGWILVEMGKLAFYAYKLDKAQQYFFRALQHYENLNWRLEMAGVLKYLARVHSLTKNKDISKKLCYEAITIYKDFLNPIDEKFADIYLILGEVAMTDKDYDLALEFLEQAQNIKILKYVIFLFFQNILRHNNSKHQSLAQVYIQMGLVYSHVEDYLQAIQTFKLALNCQDQRNIQRAQILNNLGVIYSAINLANKAKKCFDLSKSIYKDLGHDKSSQFLERLNANQTQLLE